MSNILMSTADTSGFIPQAWSNRALDVLRANVPLSGVVARDVGFEAGWRGKTLTIPYPGTFSVQDKSDDTPVSPATPSGGNSVSVTLNKHKIVSFLVEDFAAAQANTNLMDRYIQPAVIALAEQFETDLWAEVANLTLGPEGTSTVDVTAAVLRAAKKDLDDAKAPLTDRAVVISPKDHIALLADNDLATYWAFSQSQAISGARIGELYGMSVFLSQLAPVSGPTTTNVALHKNAILYAVRPFAPIPAGAGVMTAQSNDPESGLSLRLSVQYSISAVGVVCQLDLLYGTVALRPDQGCPILS